MSHYAFGDLLKSYRIAHDMSQQDLANILGTTKQVISRYEKGDRDPKISTAQEYADKLGIPLSRLLGQDTLVSESVPGFSSIFLRQERIRRGFTLSSISKHSGIDEISYANIENGSREPSITQLQQIACALHASLDYLCQMEFSVDDTNDPFPLTPFEKDFITRLRRLSEEQQRAFLLILSGSDTQEP